MARQFNCRTNGDRSTGRSRLFFFPLPSPLSPLPFPRRIPHSHHRYRHAVQQQCDGHRRCQKQMDRRAQPAERRLVVDIGPRGFENSLPRAQSGGQPTARQPRETLAQYAGGDDFAHGQPQYQDQDGHGQRLESLLRQRASVEPRLPQTRAVANVTANARAICP